MGECSTVSKFGYRSTLLQEYKHQLGKDNFTKCWLYWRWLCWWWVTTRVWSDGWEFGSVQTSEHWSASSTSWTPQSHWPFPFSPEMERMNAFPMNTLHVSQFKKYLLQELKPKTGKHTMYQKCFHCVVFKKNLFNYTEVHRTQLEYVLSLFLKMYYKHF